MNRDKSMRGRLTDHEFATLQRLVANHIGVAVSPDQAEWVCARLGPRVRAVEARSYGAYLNHVESGDPHEVAEFVGALTTHFTSFFRERHHFEALAHEICRRRREAGRLPRLRVWSAGCSTGEEAYSVAMTLAGLCGEEGHSFEILATDVDPAVVAAGARGVYEGAQMGGVDAALRDRYFLEGTGENQGWFRVKSSLRQTVEFEVQNLLDPWSCLGRFDMIFCRNLFIYFSSADFERTVTRFEDVLVDDGYLFLGHSELLQEGRANLESLGKTVYRRVARDQERVA